MYDYCAKGTIVKTWKECQTEANVPEYPTRVGTGKEYIFYSNGEVVGRVPSNYRDNIREMMKKYVSHELVDIVDVDYDNMLKQYRQANELANKLWYSSLMDEYSYLNHNVFVVCYDEAYDRGHSAGFDEVANCMINVVSFAGKIMKAHDND